MAHIGKTREGLREEISQLKNLVETAIGASSKPAANRKYESASLSSEKNYCSGGGRESHSRAISDLQGKVARLAFNFNFMGARIGQIQSSWESKISKITDSMETMEKSNMYFIEEIKNETNRLKLGLKETEHEFKGFKESIQIRSPSIGASGLPRSPSLTFSARALNPRSRTCSTSYIQLDPPPIEKEVQGRVDNGEMTTEEIEGMAETRNGRRYQAERQSFRSSREGVRGDKFSFSGDYRHLSNNLDRMSLVD